MLVVVCKLSTIPVTVAIPILVFKADVLRAALLLSCVVLWLVLFMLKAKSVTHQCVEHDTHVLLSCEPRLPLLIVCDHASRRIPTEMNNLGVSEAHLCSHIAMDIGAGDVARKLGSILGVPVVLASNSRLVIDCNRTLDDPTA